MSEVSAKILKQVEFYFSDSNLPRDKFLKGLVDKDAEGWVEITTLASFARMKALSTDIDVVVAAIKTSPSLLKVNEDGTKVKRCTPLPETTDFAQQQTERSSYAKGFPEDTTLDIIEEFFTSELKEGEKLNAVRMRRMKDKDKKFKGSVFLEFSTKETAERVAGLTLKYKDTDLVMMTKAAYLDMKKKERANNDSKKRKHEDSEDKQEEQKEKEIVKGLIVHISGLGDDASRESIKECFESVEAKVAWVEYSRGKPEGYVRLDESTSVLGGDAVSKLTEKNAEISGAKATFKLLEGEEETAYWAKIRNEANNKRKNKGKKNFKKSKY